MTTAEASLNQTKVPERCKLSEMDEEDILDHLERYYFATPLVKNKSVLDIACGTGYGSEYLAKSGAASVTGVDLSSEAISHCNSEYQADNLEYVQGSILDFNQGKLYDCIVSFETIEHVDDYKGSLLNLYSLLKPGGTLVLSTPNRPINSPECKTLNDKPPFIYHVREFSVKEMHDAIKEAGFKDIQAFGQKQRLKTTNKILLGITYVLSKKLKFLKSHFSAKVTENRPNMEPRYSIYVCRK